ncbi:olfactory receptor 6K3-like [Discoglossus pictus]
MENVSTVMTSFLLLGLVELQGYEYLFGSICLIIYFFIMLFSVIIVLVILTEESLHEPMYILICNLVLNGVFGSTSCFPKLITDLFSKSNNISRSGCFIQAMCFLVFGLFEISTITIMAYDRYLAVCYPLHYRTMMTKEKVLILISGGFTYSFLANLGSIILTVILPLCGTQIKNIFCGNMAIANLSCVSASLNVVYGTITTVIFLIFTILFIAHSYVRIIIICFTVSKDASQKAIHTLVTHLLSFSIFLVGILFVFLRFRTNSSSTPFLVQILLSFIPVVFSPLSNPLIYGIRTKVLRTRVIYHLQKIHLWKNI